MKIALTLSQLQKIIIVHLYFSTYKGEYINPITEKQLRKKLKRKSSLYNSLKSLVKKGYVMRTFKDGIYYYGLSPNGEKVYDLLGLINELDIDMTDSERYVFYLMSGYNPEYQMKEWRESKLYETMCCQCFSLAIVKEDKLLAKDNLCPKCQIEQGKVSFDF